VSRHDLLDSPEARRMISEKAAEIGRTRQTGTRDQEGDWAEAERQVLRGLLGLDP
jgi:hypothetical protein